MKKIALFLICCLVSLNIFAQSEAANWYFGDNAGIRFNPDGTITELTDGQLNTDEGCTTISDRSRNLLFYTDGRNVWNKNHTLMMNGTGLLGDPSSSQSAIIVPKPNNENIYYIFTVDNIKTRNDPTNSGLNYSEVDITLDGGLGGVITKNINLVKECSEKVTAVLKDCISKSIWVVTLSSLNGNSDIFDTFYAFEVNTTGINTTPIKSTFSTLKIKDGRGNLKLSPDGTKLACANANDGLYLYDFDVDTGVLSNQELIEKTGSSNTPYGIEFSPNSQLLYTLYSNDFFGEGDNNPSSHISTLVQYNLTSINIENSGIIIDNRQQYRGGLQLGPNGKIYRAMSNTYRQGSPYLSTVNNPNVKGIGCNYEHNAVSLSRNSRQGLPPFITSLFSQKIDIIGNNAATTNLPLCIGDTYTLKAENIPGAIYSWTLDEVPLAESDFDLVITQATQAGHYKVFIDPNDGGCETFEGEAFVTYNPNPVAFNHTLTQCDEDGTKDGRTLFNLNEANTILTGGVSGLSTKFYSDSARTIEVDGNAFSNTSNPQTLFVKVINDVTGCFDFSELTINVSLTSIDDFTATPLCDELNSEDGINTFNLEAITTEIQSANSISLPITYFATYNDALLEQNDLGNSFNNTTPYSQTIYARAENDNNCYGISEVLLTIYKLPNIETEALTYYCLNKFPETIKLNAGILNDSPSNYIYNWSNGASTYEIDINEIGTYTVTVTNADGCSKGRTITVEASNIATFENIEVVDVTQNNTITVLVSGEGVYEYRLINNNNVVVFPFQESNIFENVSPGIYTITVRDIKNNCGTVQNMVSVVGFPKFFTPNNDGDNDTWQVLGISGMFQPNTNIRIFNRFGKLIKQLNPLGKGWDGLLNGKKLPADDYWFAVTLQDGRIFKNHFTLKY